MSRKDAKDIARRYSPYVGDTTKATKASFIKEAFVTVAQKINRFAGANLMFIPMSYINKARQEYDTDAVTHMALRRMEKRLQKAYDAAAAGDNRLRQAYIDIAQKILADFEKIAARISYCSDANHAGIAHAGFLFVVKDNNTQESHTIYTTLDNITETIDSKVSAAVKTAMTSTTRDLKTKRIAFKINGAEPP